MAYTVVTRVEGKAELEINRNLTHAEAMQLSEWQVEREDSLSVIVSWDAESGNGEPGAAVFKSDIF